MHHAPLTLRLRHVSLQTMLLLWRQVDTGGARGEQVRTGGRRRRKDKRCDETRRADVEV